MSQPNTLKLAFLCTAALVGACSKSDDDCPSDKGSSCESPADGRATPLAQDLAPLPGEGPTYSPLTTSGYTVSWTAATDLVTGAAGLEYRLIKAENSEDMDSLSEALNISAAAIVLDWTSAVLSKAISDPEPQATYYAVLVRDEVGNVALYPPQPLTTASPTAGTAITFSDVTTSGFAVAWGAATSPSTASENLEYRVVRAPSIAMIDTLAEARSASSIVLDWTKNTLTTQVSDLSGNATVAIAVLVRDESDRVTLYAPKSIKTGPNKLIFKTNTQFSSTQLTPSTNADTFCNADTAKPSGRGLFKALISAPDRIACISTNCTSNGAAEHIDWVMEANRTYENPSGEDLWTTNAAAIVLDGAHPAILANSNQFAWTGFDSGWVKATSNCLNWTSASSPDAGRAGTANATNAATWTSFLLSCNSMAAIYCVEQ